ncbi:hypothetical protein [Mycolicibacterium frederiksbergense]|uniref:hypothetical protein n=1 Tax=Mycolicibacterium frederiksbergense TaxID=117567 RepID=UPI00265C6EE5|nr:hypothetical protein [Mycolicibacterium frederiksbergense]MDO0973788.1 hypothetical protein [Mycolicibacterium frederiksbergense]
MSTHRVIFPDPDIWTTPKESTMTDQPAPVDRPLTDAERHLLNEILEWKIGHNIAQQGVHVDHDSVTAALDDLNKRTPLHRQYDEHHVHIHTGNPDHTILTVRRTWLAFHASPYVAEITEDELTRAMSRGDIT